MSVSGLLPVSQDKVGTVRPQSSWRPNTREGEDGLDRPWPHTRGPSTHGYSSFPGPAPSPAPEEGRQEVCRGPTGEGEPHRPPGSCRAWGVGNGCLCSDKDIKRKATDTSQPHCDAGVCDANILTKYWLSESGSGLNE